MFCYPQKIQWAALLLLCLAAATVGTVSAQSPFAATLPATGMSNSVARLNGTVNPGGLATSAWFEWGTASFDYQPTAPVALGSGLATLAVSNNLSGLTPGILYHGRVVASNSLGLVRGREVPFGSPAILLNGGAMLTNECHSVFTDPTTVSGTLLALGAGYNHCLGLKSDGTVIGWGNNNKGQTTIPAGLSNVVALAGGELHSLALKSDGTVAVWGDGMFFQLNIPAGLSNVVAIAGGGVHSLALKSDGTVVAWGYNGFGETTIPAGLSNVVAIAAGRYHSLALKSDGTVAAWGQNNDGQVTVPAGLSNVVAIAGGYSHSLALKNDGTVAGWGWNGAGQVNIPSGLSTVAALGGGFSHSVALRSNGTVAAWGYNVSGQATIPAGLSNVVALAIGYNYNLALRSDGTAVAWGDSGSGQTTIPAGLNTLSPFVDRNISTNPPGSYLLTYTSTNGLGGIAAPATRTVIVIDTAPPVIAVLGNNPLFNRLNVPFVDPGATALDACGGSRTVSTNHNVNVAVIGSYTVTYNSTDSFGNTTNAVRTVVVANLPAVATQFATGVTSNAATLNGAIDPGGSPAGYYFQYGTTTSYGSVTVVSNLATGTTILAVNSGIESLWPGTLYHFRLVATNNVGTNAGGDLTFTTPAVPPAVVTQPATDVTTNTATLNGIVNPAGAATGYYFQYGTTTNYGSTTGVSNLAAGTNTFTVTNLIGSLSPGTLYHFRLAATNSLGTSVGADATFRTLGAPALVTQPATGVTTNAATLNGTVNPAGFATGYYFQYGTTTNYGSATSVSNLSAGTNTFAVTNLIGSLSPGALYHFRIVATNLWGTNAGADLTFSAGLLPLVVTQPATGMSNSVARLNGTVNPGSLATSAWFEWGTASFDYQPTAPVALGSGLATLAVSYNLSGLTPGVFYHGRLVASNSLGLVRGRDVPFGSPGILLNGGAMLTNECHSVFTDPTTVSGTLLALGAGYNHCLGLKSDGTVVGWGNNNKGQTTIPAGLSNVVALAGGDLHSLALKSDGTVAVWGDGMFFQLNIPAGLSNVVAIAGGGVHSLALKSDGTVVAWGYNGFGETTIPAGLSNVVAIAAGHNHSLALKSDGTVAAWGENNFGQVAIPAGLSNVMAISAGYNHSLALKSDGTVAGWGWNGAGQVNIPAGLSNVAAIGGGFSHSVALRSDGTLAAWGYNLSGQATIPAGLSNVVALGVGDSYNLALRRDGTAVAWGDSDSGQTTIPAGLNMLNLTVNGSVNTNAPGSYLLAYTSTNGLGGIATVTRNVVVRDSIPPVITVLGNNPLTNTLNVPFVDPGATALDACGGALAVSTNSNVNVAVGGSYTVTYASTDSSGNTTNQVRTVLVLGPPAVTTQPATSATATAAILNGTVNPGGFATGYYFQYGATTNYGSFSSTNTLAATNTAQSVSSLISGLASGTMYHFRIVGINIGGTVLGADLAFTTATIAPAVTTLAASGATGTNATLNGTVNPNGAATVAYFQYGLTTNYGSFSVTNSMAATNATLFVANPISGLTSGATYHFRLVASNGGGSAFGADRIIGISPRAFTGADPGQGLDLQGAFVYAVHLGDNAAPGLIGEANFTADGVSGVTITTPGGTLNTINDWASPNFGATTDGLRLAQVMRSIRWTGAPGTFTVNLGGLQVGGSYKLQLLFIEANSSTDRAFNVNVNGTAIVPNFRLLDYGPSGTPIVIPYLFTAASTSALIQLGGGSVGNDHNPILSAFTLETPAPPFLSSVTRSGTNLVFSVTGGSPSGNWTLLTATNVTLPLANWTTNRSGTFDGLGGVTLTNGITGTEAHRFFTIRAQ